MICITTPRYFLSFAWLGFCLNINIVYNGPNNQCSYYPLCMSEAVHISTQNNMNKRAHNAISIKIRTAKHSLRFFLQLYYCNIFDYTNFLLCGNIGFIVNHKSSLLHTFFVKMFILVKYFHLYNISVEKCKK